MRIRTIVLTALCLCLIISGSGLVGSAVADNGGNTNETVQSDIKIDPAIADVDGEKTIVVRLEDRPDHDVAATGSDDQVPSMQAHAADTQTAFERFADGNPHVEIERQFWIANAILVTVDTDQIPIERLGTIDQVTAVHDNFDVNALDGVAAEGTASTTDTTSPAAPSPTTESISSSSQTDTTYGLEMIRAPDTWEWFETRGEGVRVAVLDSGIDEAHDDLQLTEDGWAEFDDEGEQIDSEPYDSEFHGTHVSGTVAGGDASGTWIGVAPDVELMHGKVLDDSGGTFAQVTAGMEWAVANDADIVSMSLGGPNRIDAYIEHVHNAEQADSIVVAASGNDGEGTSSSPGDVYEVFAVGATDENDDVRGFSGGESVDKDEWDEPPAEWPDHYAVPAVSAPGSEVLSAYPDNQWVFLNGTSMAAPHVSGAIALLYSSTDENPSPAETRELFETTAEDIDEGETRQGNGRIDVWRAVNLHEYRTTVEPMLTAPSQANVSEPATFALEDDTSNDGLDAYQDAIDAYEWDFGDGTEMTTEDPNVTHAFDEADPGETIEVSVTIEDVGGETQTVTTNVEIIDEVLPIATLDANKTENVEVGLDTVAFDASESTDNHEIDRYEWAVDNEHTETTDGPSIEHTFADPGNQAVSVTVVDASENENTTSVTVDVVDTVDPTAALETPDDSLVGTDVTFNASESTDNHDIDQYRWQFGDGSVDETTDPVTTHTFDETGEYTVNLTVSDPSGNENATSTPITVRGPPSVALETPAARSTISEANATVEYTLADTDLGNASEIEYRVEYADAAEGADPVVDWTAAAFESIEEPQLLALHTGPLSNGEYLVSIRLLDEQGEVLEYDTATDERTITVDRDPAVDLAVQPADNDYPKIGPENPAIVNVTTTDHRHESTMVTITKGEETVDHWDLSAETGDGEAATAEWDATNDTDVMVPSGEYEVVATATDDLGNQNTSSTTASVDTNAPTVSIDSTDGESEHEGVVYANETTDLEMIIHADDGRADHSEVQNVSVDLLADFTTYREPAIVDQTDDTTWTATVDASALTDEGEYHVRAEVTDWAKNQNETTDAASVKYDRTAPELSTVITDYDEGDESATVEIRSNEPLDDEPSIEVTNSDGDQLQFNGPFAVGESSTHWTGTFDITERGNYNLTATGTDRAGNTGTEMTSTTIHPTVATENQTLTIYNDQTGMFMTLNTTADVGDAFVTTSETRAPPHQLESNMLGVEFLTTKLGSDLDAAVENATIGIPTDENRLPDGIATDDDRTSLQWYNDSKQQWDDRNLTVRNFEGDGDDSAIEGEYWTATVDGFSTYGVVLKDDSPPELVDVTPADGDTLDHDTEEVSIELKYEDDISGVNTSSIDLYIDDKRVTDDDYTQITSSRTTYGSLAVESGKSYEIRLEVADEADNEAVFETGFEVAAEESEDDNGDGSDDSDDSDDSGNSGGGGGGAPAPQTDDGPDHPEPEAVISIDPDPAMVGEEITFSGADSVDEERTINSYDWEIDGATFDGESVTKAFDAAGTYDVELSVGNDLGESDTATATVTVEEDKEEKTDEDPTDEDPADEDLTDEDPDDEVPADDESPDNQDDDSIPGFGLTVAIVSLLSVALLVRRRQH